MKKTDVVLTGLWGTAAATVSVAVLAVSIAVYPLIALADKQDETAIKRRINSLRSELNEYKTQEQKIRSEIAEINRQTRINRKKIRDIAANLQKSTSELKELRIVIEPLKARLAGQQEKIIKLMKLLYRLGPGRELQVFLRPDQPQMFSRLRSYHNTIRRERHRLIKRYQTSLAQYTRLEQALVKLTKDQLQQQNELSVVELVSSRLRHQYQTSLSLLNKNIAVTTEQLETLLSNLEELTRDTVQPAIAFAAMRGKLSPPLSGPWLNAFGAIKAHGLTWRGIRIAADNDQDVRAMYEGRIIYADQFGRFSLLLIIDHGDDYLSVYGYNEALLHNTGSSVTTQEPVATAGNDPDNHEKMLYFELRHKSKAIDPVEWFRH